MEIMKLKEAPQYTDTVIEWLNSEFGTSNSRKFYEGIITHSLNEDKLPLTFLAVEEGELLGTVGLWRGDLLSRQDLYPWFSGLVVNKNYRNKGIGKKLQDYVLAYCKEKGYQEIYLYTDLVDYYEKNGWIIYNKGYEYTGNEISIYKFTL